MVISETSEATPADSKAELQAQTGLRPIMTLLAATLQAASQPCSCETCALVRSRAKDLVPLVARMSDVDGG